MKQTKNTLKRINQIHPPRKKHATKDKLGNDRNRLWLKDGNTTMLLTKGITSSAAQVLQRMIKTFLNANELKTSLTFLITK